MQDTAGTLTYFGTVIHLYTDLLDQVKGIPCLLTECYSLQYNQNWIRLQNLKKIGRVPPLKKEKKIFSHLIFFNSMLIIWVIVVFVPSFIRKFESPT